MLEELAASINVLVEQTKINYERLGVILGVLWGVFFITRLDMRLLALGIIPRQVRGLPGIVCAPFLHANFNHLFFNSIPLVVLADFLLINGTDYFIHITLWLILGSGVLVWLFGKSGLHIGASSVITGYWAILVSDIFVHGTIMAVLLGIICVYYFAGIFLGVFPGRRGVSWEGHFFGLVVGFLHIPCYCATGLFCKFPT